MARNHTRLALGAIALVLVAALAPGARAQDPVEDAIKRAHEHVRRNERDKAIEVLEKHVDEAGKRRAELRMGLVQLYEQARRKDDAERLLRKILNDDEGPLASQAAWRLMNLLQFSFHVWSDRTWGPGDVPQIGVNCWSRDDRKRDPIPFELYRVNPEKVRAELESAPEALELALASPPAGALEKLDAWQEEWPDRKRGRREPLKVAKASKAGLYLLVARPAGIPIRLPIVVASHALVVKRSGEQALVFVAERADGKPIGGLALQGIGKKDGKPAIVSLGETDATGRWEGALPASGMVFAWRDGALAASHSWWYGGRAPFVSHFSTDRPIYRPGHVVHWKAIVRTLGPTGEHGVPEAGKTFKVTVRDANGAEVWKGDKTVNEFGTFSGEVELREGCALGAYWVDLGTGQPGTFRVEEYRKPEYQVTVSAPGHVVQGDVLQAKVQAKYYFGAPVTKAKVRWQVFRRPHWRPWWTCFPTSWSWYYDADEENPWRGWGWGPGQLVKQGEGDLAPDGTFPIETALPKGEERWQDELVTVVAYVTDASRREESGSAQVLAPRASFSLHLQQERWVYRPGDEVVLQVKALDPENRPRAGVALAAKATIRVYKDREGWKDEKVVATSEATTDANGSAVIRVSADARGSLAIAVTAKDEKEREVAAHASVWLADELWANPTRSTLELVPDKKTYKVGEAATLLCSMPRDSGTALVTREREGVIAHKIETWEKGSLLLKLPIEEGDAPNVYVSVATVSGQLYHATVNLAVPPEKKVIEVELAFDKATYQPKEKAVVTVRAREKASGKPARCEVALGVADASLYALAADPAPDVRKHFLRKRPNQVRTQSSFEWHIGGQAGGGEELAQASGAPRPAAPMNAERKMARGRADAAKDEADSEGLAEAEVRTEFPDTWVWRGHLVTDEKGEARLELVVPDSLTTWRATARAVTASTQVGQATAEANVFLPVLVRAQPPRFLVQGDRGAVSALVHNYLEQPKRMKLAWKTTGPLLLGSPTITGAKVESIDGATAWVEVASKGEVHLDWFDARAEKPGLATLEVVAQTDDASDAMRTPPFPVLAHGAPRFRAWAGALESEDKVTIDLELPAGAIAEATELEVSASPSVAATMVDCLEFLAGYPYGCVEQTMSRFLPDVVALEALRKCGVTDEKLRAELPKMIQAGLDRLRGFQHGDGGWGWWENDATHPYMTAYVVYGLAMARQADVAVPEEVLERGVRSLVQQLAGKAKAKHGPDAEDPNARAYMLFALAQAGRFQAKETAACFEERSKLNHYGRAVLARALAAGKKADLAQAVAAELVAAAKTTGGTAYWEVDAGNHGWTCLDTETTAQALHALEEIGEGKDLWPKVIRWLVAHRRGRQWYSTRDTAMVVYVLAEHLVRSRELEAEEELAIVVNGTDVKKTIKIDATNVLNGRLVLRLKAGELAGAKSVTFSRAGKGACYWAANLRTVSFEEDLKASPGAITVSRSIEVVRRVAGEEKRFALSKEPLLVGDELHVTLTVSSPEVREYLLVEDPIPAGCEFVRDDLGGEQNKGGPRRGPRGWRGWDHWYAHREYRDDRMAVCATRLWPTSKNVFTYVLRCERPGDFHVLPTRATDMYAPDVGGSGDEARVSIREK